LLLSLAGLPPFEKVNKLLCNEIMRAQKGDGLGMAATIWFRRRGGGF